MNICLSQKLKLECLKKLTFLYDIFKLLISFQHFFLNNEFLCCFVSGRKKDHSFFQQFLEIISFYVFLNYTTNMNANVKQGQSLSKAIWNADFTRLSDPSNYENLFPCSINCPFLI